MLVFNVKPTDELLPQLGDSITALCCEGCRDVYYPENDVNLALEDVSFKRTLIEVVKFTYMCNADILDLHLTKYINALCSSDTILVFSCGVGLQSVVESLSNMCADGTCFVNRTSKHVINGTLSIVSACDTYSLPGYQGLTPSKYDCVLCGDCHLNATGGICPITSCSKQLVNGPCGGSSDGKCEIDSNKECGWQKIAVRQSLLANRENN